MEYVPAPIIAIVDAPNAAETAEKVTMRTEDTTNTLIPNQIRDSVQLLEVGTSHSHECKYWEERQDRKYTEKCLQDEVIS